MRHTPASQQPSFERAYAPVGFFVMRAPLLPFDELLSWGAGLSSAAALHDPSALASSLAADRASWREHARAVLERREVREALYVASPDLDASLGYWLGAPESERGQKVEHTLARYLTRMAGRATPFGLFAGWSVGTLAPRTQLIVAPQNACTRHTRLDMDYLFALSNSLAHEPALRPALHFKPNSSIYFSAGRLRYIETRVSGRSRSYHLVAVEAGEELLATLERASGGAPAAGLAAALAANDDEIAPDDAAAFIDTLIENQLLVADLAPAITGAEPIHGLIERLGTHSLTKPMAAQLAAVRDALDALDGGGLGAAPERYREVIAMLEGLPAKAEPARLFQVDMARPSAGLSLSPALVDEIGRGVALLYRIAGPPAAGPLTAFCKAFTERYEAREVPLVEALDDECGLGQTLGRTLGSDAAALLGGLSFATGRPEQIAWTRRDALLLQKVEAAARAGAHAIELSEADIDLMASEGEPAPLPDSFAAMATVAAASADALERGEARILLHSFGGPSAARLLGRFCHADSVLHEHVAAMLRAEEALDPDALFAEIVHLPEARLGNVLCRPTLRDHEIVYLGQSGVPEKRQIPITDLLVSVDDRRITLRSERFGRRVVPRLSSAHNYYRGISLYRFLGALQGHGLCAGMSWDWGPLASAAFLPRVTYGRLVLARARWRLDQAELKALGAAAAGAERFQAVQSLRSRRGLSRMLLLADGDNELAVDLENTVAIESLVELIKGWRSAVLIEQFPGPEELCASGPEGRFVHELVVPFARKPVVAGPSPVAAEHRPRATRNGPRIVRSFPPGSEWLYAKLYTGTATADDVLREVVAPVVRLAEQAGAIDRWFFIRYNDPDHHLRIRFHGPAQRLYRDVLPELHLAAAPLLEDGRIWRIQLDTYEREIERYGGSAGIELSEQIFHADSAAVLAIVEQSRGEAAVSQRWRVALRGMDQLLIDMGLDTAARHTLIRQTRDSYAREVRADDALRRQLGDAYRRQRKQLEDLLGGSPGETTPAFAAGLAALRARSSQLAPVAAALAERERAGQLVLSGLAPSFAHMHVNRLLRSEQRRQELVLYEFLDRLYEGRAARARI